MFDTGKHLRVASAVLIEIAAKLPSADRMRRLLIKQNEANDRAYSKTQGSEHLSGLED